MPSHVAFLRGLNVGGHRVKMDRVVEIVREAGLVDVRSFLASGNILFTSKARNLSQLEAKIERSLQAGLAY
ncbi:MAG: DUF1697 domain-containing protein, partial [Rhodothermales bacterium]|nr:DUF1697 domain-containing protein [Rhodothermales bacterium]